MPIVTHGVCCITSCGCGGHLVALEESFGLKPETINVLFKSAFFKGFDAARYRASYSELKKSDLPRDRRLQLAKILAAKATVPAEKAALKFVETILTLEGAAMCRYLLESTTSFDLLAEWFPGDARIALRSL